MITPTLETLRDLLDTRAGGLLRRGSHLPPTDDGQCQCCARELLALALGGPWTDQPDGNSSTDHAVTVLNDAQWSSDEVRTAHCLPLAVLREADAASGWTERYVLRTIREILPIVLRTAGLDDHADRCAAAADLPAAYVAARAAYVTARAAAAAYVAARAAADADTPAAYVAARAAAVAYVAADADTPAAYVAARAAARVASFSSADANRVLALSAKILRECHTGE
jgi:hypothetical protein